MGERLVVEIKRNDRSIANVYYHWSAYTIPAINITRSMYKNVLANADEMSDNELQLALIRFAENTTSQGYIGDTTEGREVRKQIEMVLSDADVASREMLEELLRAHGGLCAEDRKLAAEQFPNETFDENVSRNEGLVHISDESMESSRMWAQGSITIDLDKKMVFNGMVYEHTIEEYLDECVEEDEDDFTPPEDITQIPVDLSEFNLSEIDVINDILNINETETWLRFKDKIFMLVNG